MKRQLVDISGLVQGVGFRPFVYRVATKHGLTGLVRNTMSGVAIEAQANEQALDAFLNELRIKAPKGSCIHSMEIRNLEVQDEHTFRIEPSSLDDKISTLMARDQAPCNPCLIEFSDPNNRRYHYPFITCNDCGPRFTITDTLPFDRQNTAMHAFTMCELCRQEYSNPADRRFHAQTISCPCCGPLLSLILNNGESTQDGALERAVAIIRAGGLLAVKGVGGYQLVCSAMAGESIARIRRYKDRRQKPFAVMSPDVSEVETLCDVSTEERNMLCSAVAPVVLLYLKDRRYVNTRIDTDVAPGLETLGVMLPPSPLHHVLAKESGWLVVTSANRRGEPILFENNEAAKELAPVVDGLLHHNREIIHLADDSVVRLADEQLIVLRHARGLAPTEIRFSRGKVQGIGFGGHAKSAFSLADNNRLILSQHIGDLDSRRSCDRLEREVNSFERLYRLETQSSVIVCDAHAGYGSSRLAIKRSKTVQTVFHHEAHLEALIAEAGHSITGKSLALVADGTGFGADGTVWGGEFFLVDGDLRQRIGSLLPFPLLGGECAVKEPRRSALGMLYETYGEQAFTHPFVLNTFRADESSTLKIALKQRLNATNTSSLGRLFDGFAALLGVCTISNFESQAATALEDFARNIDTKHAFPVTWAQDEHGCWRWDWRNIVGVASEAQTPQSRAEFSAMFHATIVQAALCLAQKFNIRTFLLSGGVFQNAVLVKLFRALVPLGFSVVCHSCIPPGDGGLALGQLARLSLAGKKGADPCV